MRIREYLQEVQRLGYDCDLTCRYVADRRSRGRVADYLDGVFCKLVTKEEACYCKFGTYRNTVSSIDQQSGEKFCTPYKG